MVTTRILAADVEEIMKLVQRDNYSKFQGELSLSWDPNAVTFFIAGWKVIPVNTFRQGYRRTWVGRAAEQPMSMKLQHDCGLEVMKRTPMQRT